MRQTSLTLVGVLTMALFAAASTPARPDTASWSRRVVPFVTVSAGASTQHPRSNRVFLGRSLAATKGWWRWLSPGARKALRGLNFDRYGVVVAFRLQKQRPQDHADRSGLTHARPLAGCPEGPTARPDHPHRGRDHLVGIERSYLRGVSRLVVRGVTVE